MVRTLKKPHHRLDLIFPFVSLKVFQESPYNPPFCVNFNHSYIPPCQRRDKGSPDEEAKERLHRGLTIAPTNFI